MEPSIRRAMSFWVAVILSLTVLFDGTLPAFAADTTTDMSSAEAATVEATITPVTANTALNGARFLSLVGGVLGFAIVGGFVISGVRHLEDARDGDFS